jgi:cytochrome c heme-lyase
MTAEGAGAGAGAGAGCPVKERGQAAAPVPASKCPVQHGDTPGTTPGTSPSPLNPFNNIPFLSQLPAPGQAAPLSTDRATSTIPKREGAADPAHTWEYPSPQQFYNALQRKGWDTPVHHIPVMVDIHNFLNEAAWFEVLRWEQTCHGECQDVTLDKFQGRPQDLSPKARFFSWFGVERPFGGCRGVAWSCVGALVC